MEVVDIQEEACKFPRIGNGRGDDEEDGEFSKRVLSVGGANRAGAGAGACDNRLRGWHHSSRIIRVARASGGKDRHSKVLTSKGLRDRRVRLSVATAIQFYDLQDRLGFEQPSKAVEWLIGAASDAIAELPSLNSSFHEIPKQVSDEKMGSDGTTNKGFDSAELELDGEVRHQQNQTQHHLSLVGSACSSTSETSKGSGLSLSRSEILVNRAKARDRARERTAKEKEKGQESRNAHTVSNSPSFTELLTAGINGGADNNSNSTNSERQNNDGEQSFCYKPASMDYFASTGIIGLSSSSSSRPGGNHTQSPGFTGQFSLGNPHQLPLTILPSNISATENNPDRLQHFSFVPENLNDYNLNFTISAGVAGLNRGTLQSNISPSLLPHFQRFPHLDGQNVPFFLGAPSPAGPQLESHLHHHHQLAPPLFDGGWQLCYADGSHHSDQKGKGKN